MYVYEPGLIARLLGAVLEAAHVYGVRLLRCAYKVYMNVCVPLCSINSL